MADADPPYDRVTAVFFAKLAEETERYEEMVDAMKKLAKKVEELTPDERFLLSVAYMKSILAPRASRRLLSSKLEKESDSRSADLIAQYQRVVEVDIRKICCDVVKLLDENLLPSRKPGDHIASIFYLKMRADYLWALAEIETGDQLKMVVALSNESYESATKIAREELSPTDPIRLNMALDYSRFLYEILGSHERAYEMAETAWEDGIPGIHMSRSDEEEFKHRVEAMKLLQENVIKWKNAQNSGNAGPSA